MKKLILLFVVFSAAIATTYAQQAKFDAAAARKAINKWNNAFCSSFAAGDSIAMANLYADDAIVLPPNTEPVKGHDAISRLWGSFIRMGKVNIQLTTTELTGSGNIAVETGRYNLKVQPDEKDAIQDHGKYLVIWQKQSDDSWKMIRDMFSSNLPPSAS